MSPSGPSVAAEPAPPPRSARFIQSRSVSGVQPIFAEIDDNAAQREACSASCSSTIRTARSRTSGENLFVVLLVMAPSSQELEPPANPGRFNPAGIREFQATHEVTVDHAIT